MKFVTNKNGRLLFKSQRSLSVPSTKEDKSTDDAEQQVLIDDLSRLIESCISFSFVDGPDASYVFDCI